MTKKIPEKKYLDSGHFTYITEKLFKEYHSEKEWETFDRWLYGQTISEVNGETAIYAWDYERWVKQGKKKNQGVDWD